MESPATLLSPATLVSPATLESPSNDGTGMSDRTGMSRPKGLPLTFHSLGQLWALMSLSRTGLVPAGAPCHGWLEEWPEESVISKCSRLDSVAGQLLLRPPLVRPLLRRLSLMYKFCLARDMINRDLWSSSHGPYNASYRYSNTQLVTLCSQQSSRTRRSCSSIEPVLFVGTSSDPQRPSV